jgi:hypothetical protein
VLLDALAKRYFFASYLAGGSLILLRRRLQFTRGLYLLWEVIDW